MATNVAIVKEATNERALRDSLNSLNSMNYGKPELTRGSNGTQLKISNSFNYAINGNMYSRAIGDYLSFTATVQPQGKYCKYLLSVDVNQALTLTKGNEATTRSLSKLPALPDNNAPVGYIDIFAASASFTFGTDNLATSGAYTVTYHDLATVVQES